MPRPRRVPAWTCTDPAAETVVTKARARPGPFLVWIAHRKSPQAEREGNAEDEEQPASGPAGKPRVLRGGRPESAKMDVGGRPVKVWPGKD